MPNETSKLVLRFMGDGETVNQTYQHINKEHATDSAVRVAQAVILANQAMFEKRPRAFRVGEVQTTTTRYVDKATPPPEA